MIIEAWHHGGVLLNRFGARHAPGTEVDILEFEKHPSRKQMEAGWDYLERRMGWEYDFAGVFRFPLRIDRPSKPGTIFCSRLVAEWSLAMGIELVRKKPHLITPNDVAESSELKPFRTVRTRSL
jgi:hypothetical protein